jgi:hypothetical protein
VLDQEGVEPASIEEAAKEAGKRARAIASKDALNGLRPIAGAISIADDKWHTVMELRF